MQMTTTITTDENNRVLMIDERKRSKLWMVILGYATCTLPYKCVFNRATEISSFLTNRENVQSVFLQRTCELHSVWSVHCLLIFCTQISSPLFSSHHWRPFFTKRIPIPVFLECCSESFSQETIASSPLFSVCSGLLVFILRATKLSEYPTASDNLLHLLGKIVKKKTNKTKKKTLRVGDS